jgi:heme-degrading monooxygenase HmoA
MSVVRINAITVPPGRAEMMVERFANRAGEVAGMDGFEAFELLRPSDGRERWLVYTRWATREHFDAWVQSEAFTRGHALHREGGPVGSASELWGYDVVQAEGPRAA